MTILKLLTCFYLFHDEFANLAGEGLCSSGAHLGLHVLVVSGGCVALDQRCSVTLQSCITVACTGDGVSPVPFLKVRPDMSFGSLLFRRGSKMFSYCLFVLVCKTVVRKAWGIHTLD